MIKGECTSDMSVSCFIMETDGFYTLVYLYDYAGSPVGMKTVTTANSYIGYYKLNPVGFKSFCGKRFGSKSLSYVFAAYGWVQTYISFKTNDPVERAYQRGYSLV